VYDTSGLSRTSTKRELPWRETSLTFIRISADARIQVAHTIADKRLMLDALRSVEDCLLAVRQARYPMRQDVMVVDDAEPARRALADKG
jgi:hypothetical protein